MDFFDNYFAEGSRLRLPWQTVCEAVPMPKVRSFVDQWLLSSGTSAISTIYEPGRCICSMELYPKAIAMQLGGV